MATALLLNAISGSLPPPSVAGAAGEPPRVVRHAKLLGRRHGGPRLRLPRGVAGPECQPAPAGVGQQPCREERRRGLEALCGKSPDARPLGLAAGALGVVVDAEGRAPRDGGDEDPVHGGLPVPHRERPVPLPLLGEVQAPEGRQPFRALPIGRLRSMPHGSARSGPRRPLRSPPLCPMSTCNPWGSLLSG